MKKLLFFFSILFISLNSWGQINTLPAVQSFDDPFTTGTDVEFLPNWMGNDVQANARIYRDIVDFNSAPAAMSIVPTGNFEGDVRINLDLTNYADVSLDLLAKSVENGTGDRSAVLTIDTSIDGGANWIHSVNAGSFPNTTQADFTNITYALPVDASNQSDVIVRMSITRSAGSGTTAKLVIDDVEIYESTGTNPGQEVLVHYWNFNDNSSEAAITTVSESLVTGAALTHIAGGISEIDFAGGTGQNFDLDNLNARNGDVAGTHLRFNDPIGGALQFDLPTTGYENVTVKFAARRSGQGAGTQVWSYTVDGINFIPFQNVVTFNANPILITLDFTAIPDANDNPDFGLLVEFEEGNGGTGGNNRFDNFTLDAFPLGTAPTLISNPTPHLLSSGDYVFNEWDAESPQGTYPANMMFWTHATTDPDLSVNFMEDWNCVYNLESRSRVEGHGVQGFSFVNTGNPQYEVVCDGGTGTGDEISNGRLGAAVLALNTTNSENILVEWTARTIAQNNRVYGLRMQYRIGNGNGDANADWQDFSTPIEYISDANGHSQNFTTPLPQALEDQSLVQLRWVYYYISGSGSRAQIALDDITVSHGSTGPSIIANPGSLQFTQIVGTPSEEHILTVSGLNLTDDITLDAPNDFELSLTSGGGFTNTITLTENNGTVQPTSVYVRFNRATEGTSTGTILISSIDAATIAIDVEGTASVAFTTNPEPFILNSGAYSFTQWNENAQAGTYPANMIFWTHATTDPDLNVEFVEDWNCLYNLTSRSRINGEGTSGFSFVNTGNSQFTGVCDGSDPNQSEGETIVNGRSGAAVLALNTLNRANISVLWTARTIAQNNRVYGLRMQYRIGEGNGNANIDWQDFDTPIEYISGATGHSEDFSIILPASCEDQPVIQLRWVYYYLSGSGSRAQIALDDIMIEGAPLSVNDFDFDNRFSLYPNPTSDIVYFSEISDVTLYDITGKILLTVKNATQINVESLASGIYIIRNEKGQVLRLVKK